MAVVWAKQAGNWSTASLWAFWNESTQQIEDYGQTPQIGDIVYCNGYAVQFTGNINIGNGTFTNGVNPYTNRSGGYFNYSANPGINIIGNCEQYGFEYLFRIQIGNSNAGLNITGNIYNEDAETFAIFCNWSIITTINGSLTIGNTAPIVYLSYGNPSNRITINCSSLTIYGNATEIVHSNVTLAFAFVRIVTATLPISPINVNVTTFEMIGDILLINNITFTTATITGDISANGYLLAVTTLNINGSITYKSTNNSMGVRYNNLNILNPDTFTWKDVTEPRSNPFIILTDAEMNDRQQYPPEDEVKQGTEYVWGEKVGTYQQPPESVVLKGYRYDNDEKEGTLENENIVGCVTPEDVRKDVPLVGMGVVGTLVVPSVDDVREGVHFDNDSVGTLIVQGGGDRLRIANFGYYTNAQSDTYIVDITEADKPKFAVAEERILIEMFPSLDLDNIPQMYFDDLFVKYLKYRLIVEYYRTAGVNSTFTPSEPTTEIVNYRNVTCEVWLNSANIYFNAWNKKYGLNKPPQRIRL